jgi:hypothetical protein
MPTLSDIWGFLTEPASEAPPDSMLNRMWRSSRPGASIQDRNALSEDIGMGFAGGGITKVVGPTMKAFLQAAGKMTAGMSPEEIKAAYKAVRAATMNPNAAGTFDPVALRTAYPQTGTPRIDVDKVKGPYLAKNLTSEELSIQKARNAAQADIEAGLYEPMFDVSQRAHIDPAQFPVQGNTLTDAMPKKQATIDKYKQMLDTPETRANL